MLLHGWGQDPEEWAARNDIVRHCDQSGIRLLLPRAPRWSKNWRIKDDFWLAEYAIQNLTKDERRGKWVIGGFSDGARTALRAATMLQPTGVIFHSGRYVPRDLEDITGLPWHVHTFAGKKDPTRRIPVFGTNPLDLFQSLVPIAAGKRVEYVEHPAGHTWGSVSDIVTTWCLSLTA